jgi:putative tryptophan/tyrosine transport system substrate-binding protein
MEFYNKRLELLKEVALSISKLGYLGSRDVMEKMPGAGGAAMREAAQKAGIAVVWPSGGLFGEAEYRSAFTAMGQASVDAFYVSEQMENWTHRRLIIELVEKSRLPAIYPANLFVELGGLIAYGIDWPDIGRRTADVVHRILTGTKPGEIPISSRPNSN